MAKAKRKRTHHRRQRVGAMSLNPKNPLILLASVGVGYLAADKIYSFIDKAIPTKTVPATATTPAVVENVVSDTVLGAGFAGVGAALALMGKKTLPKTIAGGVMAGAGLKWALVDQGVITVGGFSSVPAIGRGVNGFSSVPAIGRIPGSLSGGYTTSRMPTLGKIPTSLNGRGYTTSRTAAAAGLM